jgi:energy-converting hydrogenase A subunit M
LANQQGQRSKRLSIDVDMVIHTTALVKSLMKQIEEDGSFDEEQFQRLGRVLEVQHDAINVLLQHLQE